MLPSSWATMTKPRRSSPIPPVTNMAMATAGLNIPPSMRKNALLQEVSPERKSKIGHAGYTADM